MMSHYWKTLVPLFRFKCGLCLKIRTLRYAWTLLKIQSLVFLFDSFCYLVRNFPIEVLHNTVKCLRKFFLKIVELLKLNAQNQLKLNFAALSIIDPLKTRIWWCSTVLSSKILPELGVIWNYYFMCILIAWNIPKLSTVNVATLSLLCVYWTSFGE